MHWLEDLIANFNMNLTTVKKDIRLQLTTAQSVGGFGSPFGKGTAVMCRKVHGFFYALSTENRNFRLSNHQLWWV